jgi:pimeloyl-ACP methyl ester carboxylesterase
VRRNVILMRQRPVVLVAVAGLSLGAGAIESASPTGPDRAPVTSSIAWTNCGPQLQCARVRAPVDWERPDGPTMSLQVIRHLASRPERRIGSLFVNGGGASGSVQLVRSDAARLDALGRGRFDVVGWALRGSRGAEPMVRCFADQQSRARFWDGLSIPSTRAQSSAYLPRTTAFTRRCGAVSGRLLEHVSTTDDARDLNHLRRLVGDRRLTYSAVSYGTFLGQTYANMFPDQVRAMALDGLVDPRTVVRGAEARFANTVVAMDRGLRTFASLCQRAGPTRCALAGHGAVAPRVVRLLARVQRAPIPAPTASPPGRLSYGDLTAALFVSLTNPAAWPQLAQDLEQAATGDGSALATLARAVLAGTRTADGEAPTAITCTDSPARRDPDDWPRVVARLTRVSQAGGPFVGWSNWAPCASWPAGAAERYRGPWNRSTTNPVLVVGTTFDPATPFANARRVARLLGDAVLLTHRGYGHTSEADPSACVSETTSRYLVNLRIPRRGTVCPSDREPFDPQFGHSRN